MKINKNDIIETLKDGGKLLGALALRIYGDSLNRAGEQAFSEAIELGIENTVAALYGAKVSDKETIRVVCEHWGISYQDAEDRLVWEKQQATIRSLRQYLKLQGYSSLDIKNYMTESKASMRIRHRKKNLWNLKDASRKTVQGITEQ